MAVFNGDGELKQEAKEVLYEIGNMGVGTAIMPIGNIREMEFRISTPNVITLQEDIFSEIDYDPEQVVVGASTRLDDNFQGSILFLLSKEFVRNTVHIMTEESYDDTELMENEDSVSAIHEMINYMTAGYAKVIGAYLNTPIYISTARVGMEKAGKVIQDVMGASGKTVNKIACVNTQFTIVDEDGVKTDESGQVLIFPDEKCIEAFIEIMGE